MPRTTIPVAPPHAAATRASSRPRRVARRAVVAATLVAGLLAASPAGATLPHGPLAPHGPVVLPDAGAVPAAAALPTFTSPTASVKGHLLEVTSSARPISPFVATDLSTLEKQAGVVGAVGATATASDGMVVAGRTATGHVVVFTSGPATRWAAADVTTLGSAPAAVGTPAVVVDPAGVTRVFFRTDAGDLVEVENDRPQPDPWFASDLTTLTTPTGGPTLAGDPVVLSTPGFPTTVYARATGGDLVSFTLTSTVGHPWYYVDVSSLAEGPGIVGTPAVVPAPDGFGLTAVFALAANGHLLEFTDDDAGFHLWSVRDVTLSLDIPALTASPTALPGLPTEVADVTSSGHLLVVSIPTVSLVGDSFQDVSALARQRLAPGHAASIVAGRAGYVVVGVSAASHLEVFHVATATATTASALDATMQPLTEQLAGADPAALDVDGQTVAFVPSAGLLGLVPRIVLTAESEDQHHARIEDTPPGSDCNPFTAWFSRGSTAGCAKGTASEEWCSDFSQWVWQTAGVDTTGITGASKTFVLWGRARQQFLQGLSATPAVGDAVVWGVLSPLWGAHVGIVVGVKGKQIEVVSGNSGPLPVASAVWDSGWFLPKDQTAQGDPIIGFVSPVTLPGTEKPRAPVPSVWPRTPSWPVVQGQGAVTVPAP